MQTVRVEWYVEIDSALIYHVQLQEVFDSHPASPSSERVKVCFKVLQGIAEQIGPFSTIMEIIMKDLKNSIFSSIVTSSDKEPFYENVPYFVLMERDEDSAAHKEAIDELQQKLKFRENDLEILYRTNLALKQKIADFEQYVEDLNSQISDYKNQIDIQKTEQDALKTAFAATEEQHLKTIGELQAAHAQAQSVIEKLTVFKGTNTDNQKEKSDKTQIESIKLKDIKMDANGMLKYDLVQSKKIERQFSEMMDYLLDDFDLNLSQVFRKREIMIGLSGGTNSESIKSIDAELNEHINQFKNRSARYLDELDLLTKHVSGLNLQEKKNEMIAKLPTIDPYSDFAVRKYSLVCETSKNGKDFNVLDSCEQCEKCGVRVLLCPHAPLKTKHVTIPPHTTHLKFSQPSLLYKSSLKITEQEALLKHTLITEDEDPLVSANFYRIWKDFYYKRGGTKPASNRNMPIPKVLGIIQELYDQRWKIETLDFDSTEDRPEIERFVDCFYKSFQDRYIFPQFSMKAIHDFFTSLQAIEKSDPYVAVFCQHLAGKEEEVWKYIYLVKNLFYSDSREFNMGIYEEKLKIIYPDRRFSKALDKFDTQLTGTLSAKDFTVAMTKILPPASTKEIIIRYALAAKEFGEDNVTVDRLTSIASYMVAATAYKSNWEVKSQISAKFANQHVSNMNINDNEDGEEEESNGKKSA
ncbi:hypothetical protein HK103_007050 [Boothiomyces macroporosus]|uniref:EF-hand domain-containing protein n=1 Tax=Boothiomyces macroporosus TaxID=261099 RepID=A0AAD5UGC9_9FUNG|nr:hypothetical protein HK103_007050 [Boothiomyces macroporosus]